MTITRIQKKVFVGQKGRDGKEDGWMDGWMERGKEWGRDGGKGARGRETRIRKRHKWIATIAPNTA